LKGRKPGLFVNFGQFPCSWTWIRIPNIDPDPEQSKECGSMLIWIHNTDKEKKEKKARNILPQT
jgi:hypothetical protein